MVTNLQDCLPIKHHVSWVFPKNRVDRRGNGLVQASIEDMVSGHLKPSGHVEENAKDDNAKDTRH